MTAEERQEVRKMNAETTLTKHILILNDYEESLIVKAMKEYANNKILEYKDLLLSKKEYNNAIPELLEGVFVVQELHFDQPITLD